MLLLSSDRYERFQKLIDEASIAFRYAQSHFDELMERPVSYKVYGSSGSFGPGALCPSRRLTCDNERVLRTKNQRKKYREYSFDSNLNLLHSQTYDAPFGLDCTMLHFDLDGTSYSRYFNQDRNAYYRDETFITKYLKGAPILFSMACSYRVYVEYYTAIQSPSGNPLVQCNWYDYYPTRMYSKNGTPILKDAPFGAENSPVLCGSIIMEPVNTNAIIRSGLFPTPKK